MAFAAAGLLTAAAQAVGPYAPPAAQAPDLRGTVALPASIGRFMDDWERARRDASADPRMRLLVAPARSMAPRDQIAFVQAEVHRKIRWMSDATQWDAHDYWASASETLQRGAGDMEDRAIVKMQALRSLGFAPRDLYLTLGRDKVAGPIAILVVRLDDQLYALDDSGGAPFAVNSRAEFEPMLTLGHGGSWLHGRRHGAALTASSASLAVSR